MLSSNRTNFTISVQIVESVFGLDAHILKVGSGSDIVRNECLELAKNVVVHDENLGQCRFQISIDKDWFRCDIISRIIYIPSLVIGINIRESSHNVTDNSHSLLDRAPGLST